MVNTQERQTYTLDLEWLKELWHRAGVMALLKAKAKSIIKTEPLIPTHEKLVYKQCAKDAITPVLLAKCIVTLMNARDNAIAPVQFSESSDDDVTFLPKNFWDVIMPWRRKANGRKVEKDEIPTIPIVSNVIPAWSNDDFTSSSPISHSSSFIQENPAPKQKFKSKNRKIYKTIRKRPLKSSYYYEKYGITPQPRPRQFLPSFLQEITRTTPKYHTDFKKSYKTIHLKLKNQEKMQYYVPRSEFERLVNIKKNVRKSNFAPRRWNMNRIKKLNIELPKKFQLFKSFKIKNAYYHERRSKRDIRRDSPKKLSNVEKLRLLKEYTEMKKHVENFSKRINSDNSNFLRKHGFPFIYDTQPSKNLTFAEDVIDLINGYLRKANMSELDGINLLSPRIMNLFSKDDSYGKSGILSPTLLSFQKDGFLPWPDILQFLTGSDKVDRDAWLEFILETSGGDKALDKTLSILRSEILELKTKIYPTVMEMEQMERDWTTVNSLHSRHQKRSLDDYGYTFLEPEQLELAYRNQFTPHHGLNLSEYSQMSVYEREKILEDDIRKLAKLDRLFDQYGNYIGHRLKRQAPVTDLTPQIIALRPVAFSNRINQGLILKANILSPTAFTTEINSLVALVHLTLSPTAFSAAILNPAILFSRVLSPVVFRAEVLHPRILHAWVLSPTALAARVLSPRIMQVRILSSLSLIVNVLSPGLIHPRVFSPDGPIVAVLSPQILAPRVGSPNHMVINILSPPIMADAIDEPAPKNGTVAPATPMPWQPWG